MRRVLLLLLLGFAAWRGYAHLTGAAPADAVEAAGPQWPSGAATVAGRQGLRPAGASFRCDGRTHCSQMRSRAEAEYFVRHCPDTKMDGDGDGEPCENDSRW
ncbi:excalibur calcium-binding domain-containing protein [Cognatilysobacter tabacisoli]|uniref:excalibur calcium-binding domain-containing protein n=1 Tax=Cognatilysobacter tabacisoli TaxID=2315424 RepID=UPI000E6B4CC8|nr:excalibur calcium-binding domain-containing protein [Lysobacter tabacisoli]